MKWTKVLTITGLLAVVGVALGCWWPFNHRPQVLRLPGVVESQQVRLSSKVGGRVAKVTVHEGEVIEAGRPLVHLDLPELRAQRQQLEAKLKAAQAELTRANNGARAEEKDAARATLQAAQARLEKLEAGTRQEEKDQARAELDSLLAQLERSARELERNTRLYNGGRSAAVSRADLEAATATHGQLVGQVNAARARLDLLEAGPRVEEIAEARAERDKARANHELLLAGTRPEDVLAAEAKVAELQARLSEIDANLAEGVVIAPERAVVEVLAVRKGDVVGPNQPVARVLRAEDLWVKVFVPETELGEVRLGQAVTVTIDAYPGRRFDGYVEQVAGVSEFTPRNIQSASERQHQVFAVKVRVPDPRGAFHSGMAAEVQLPLHD
jgi:multidrug resistance efflux pump